MPNHRWLLDGRKGRSEGIVRPGETQDGGETRLVRHAGERAGVPLDRVTVLACLAHDEEIHRHTEGHGFIKSATAG